MGLSYVLARLRGSGLACRRKRRQKRPRRRLTWLRRASTLLRLPGRPVGGHPCARRTRSLEPLPPCPGALRMLPVGGNVLMHRG